MHERAGFSNVFLSLIAAAILIGALGVAVFIVKTNKSEVQSPILPSPAVIPPTPVSQGAPVQKLSALFSSSSPISKANNLDAVAAAYNLQFTKGQASYLEKNKFLLVPLHQSGHNEFDDMLFYFDLVGGNYEKEYRASQNTKLVAPDIVLHAYHKYFDLTLSELEQVELSPLLSKFLTELSDNVLQAMNQAPPDAASRYQNIFAQLVVARTLLENTSAPKPDYFSGPDEESRYLTQDQTIDVFSNAKTIFSKYSSKLTPDLVSQGLGELQLIYAGNVFAPSPLWGQYSDTARADYTQFTPRSHYTKNSLLRAYFRTMIYLGRNSYLFSKDVGIQDTNLLTNLFKMKSLDGYTPIVSWQRIMDITNFYVGVSDDVTYNEWQHFLKTILGDGNFNPQDLMSDVTLGKLKDNIAQLRRPKIFSDVVVDPVIGLKTKADLLNGSLGFRIFGQKFTFDAWVLNDLTAGQEATPVRLPSTPSALFIPAALGDARARSYVTKFLETEKAFSQSDISGFMSKLDNKSGELQKIKPEEWLGSLGSAWLDLLSTLTANHYGSNYPAYMQSQVFPDKQIQTFLGSYTELKHDTLLYAKQSYAEKGGGEEATPPLPPVVKGFVEPNVAFWEKLLLLINKTEQFFHDNKVFQNHTALPRLQEFKKIVTFYKGIAEKELKGQPITEAEYEKLRTTGLSFMAAPFNGEDVPSADFGEVALVADVHTDALENKILYEATGEPYLMIAFVDNENSPRLVVGPVFNHYEFTEGIGRRLTDEDWKKKVYENPSALPPKNFWYQSLIAK